MLQENARGHKSSMLSDFILMTVMLVVILFMRVIYNFVLTLPYHEVFIALIFAILVAFLILIYKKRIVSYRYTVFSHYADPDENKVTFVDDDGNELDMFGDPVKKDEQELDAYGDPVKKDKGPEIGTLVFERMVGDKGKIAEVIEPENVLGIFNPDEAIPEEFKIKRSMSMTVLSRKTAHKIVYASKKGHDCIYFHPSENFITTLRKTLDK